MLRRLVIGWLPFGLAVGSVLVAAGLVQALGQPLFSSGAGGDAPGLRRGRDHGRAHGAGRGQANLGVRRQDRGGAEGRLRRPAGRRCHVRASPVGLEGFEVPNLALPRRRAGPRTVGAFPASVAARSSRPFSALSSRETRQHRRPEGRRDPQGAEANRAGSRGRGGREARIGRGRRGRRRRPSPVKQARAKR